MKKESASLFEKRRVWDVVSIMMVTAQFVATRVVSSGFAPAWKSFGKTLLH
jgi:hypothetical protein